MASENEASCVSDPNFAVICSFLERFAESCGIVHPNFADLQIMLENSEEVDAQLIDLHVKLLRKARKSVSMEKWERALIKFGHSYNSEDGVELEKLGYKKSALATKLRLLKTLLEAQFDLNARFKAAVNKLTASELRLKPIGRDCDGQIYWVQQDSSLNLRVYKEDEEVNSWTMIAQDRDSLKDLINALSGGTLNVEALVDNASEDEDEESSDIDDDQGEILLDTGQPEDVKPPLVITANGNPKSANESNDDDDDDDEEDEESEINESPKDDKNKEKHHEMPPAGGEEAVNTSIPSLLSPSKGEKRKISSDEDSNIKKARMEGETTEINDTEDTDAEVGEAIEEPVMLVTGQGSGAECDAGNPGENEDQQDKEKDEKVEESGPSNAEATTASSSRPSICTPSKSSLWSIDKICGTTSSSSTPSAPSSIFSSGMLFGNLSQPSFIVSANNKEENAEQSKLVPTEQLTFKGNRRKSVEAISLGIMKEKMMLQSESVPSDVSSGGSSVMTSVLQVSDSSASTNDQNISQTSDQKPSKVLTESIEQKPSIQSPTEKLPEVNKTILEIEKEKPSETVEQQLKTEEEIEKIPESSEDIKPHEIKPDSKDSQLEIIKPDTEKIPESIASTSDVKETPIPIVEEVKVTETLDDKGKSEATVSQTSEISIGIKSETCKNEALNTAVEKTVSEIKPLEKSEEENKQQLTEKFDDPIKLIEEPDPDLKEPMEIEEAASSVEEPVNTDKNSSIPVEEPVKIEESSTMVVDKPLKTEEKSTSLVEEPIKTEESSTIPVKTDESSTMPVYKSLKTEEKSTILVEEPIKTEESSTVPVDVPIKTEVLSTIVEEKMEVEESSAILVTEKIPKNDAILPDEQTNIATESTSAADNVNKKDLEVKNEEEIVKPIEEIKTTIIEEKCETKISEESKNISINKTDEYVEHKKEENVEKTETETLKCEEQGKSIEVEEKLDELCEENKLTEETEKKPEEPITIGAALAFDYNPPESPENKTGLIIDESLLEKVKIARGRGRPTRRTDEQENEESSSSPKKGHRGRKGKKSEDTQGGESGTGSDTVAEPVRQSRRIALIKQKEEEERRKREAEALAEMQKRREEELKRKELESSSDASSDSESDEQEDEEYNGTHKRKRRKYKKRKQKTDEEYVGDAADKKRKKRKKKKKKRKRAGANPWESSETTDSSSQSDGLEHLDEEDDDEPLEFKSDHEFSPESDLELGPGEELQPAPRRARTARREKVPKKEKISVEEPQLDDYRCQKCNGIDQPEWILLCDGCDNGWHTTCLKPPLHLVPEGDWYCPSCSHQKLVFALTGTLRQHDKMNKRKLNQELRKQRLSYVTVNLDNIIPSKEAEEEEESEEGDEPDKVSVASGLEGEDEEGDPSGSTEEESSGSATSSSSSDEDNADFSQSRRQRRAAQTVNYNFEEYDEMINSAIQDEVEAAAGAGNAGKGKDISTIVQAQDEEEKETVVPEEKPPEEVEEEEAEDDAESDEEENIRQKQHAALVKLSHRRKPKRLACLDVSSEDDHDSDEDFRGSDSEDEEDDDDDFELDSDDSGGGRARGRGGAGSSAIRRSTRARQRRFDRDFINDDSDDSEAERRKRKAKRSRGWVNSEDEFDSEEASSDSAESDWGSRKRKRKAPARSRAPAKRRRRTGGGGGGGKRRGGKGKKGKAPVKKRKVVNSDSEEKPAPKVKRPKATPVKAPSPEELPRRTTRGKKINYQEIIGSDSDDAKPRGKGRRPLSDDEDEFNPDNEDLAYPRTGKPSCVLHNRVVKPPTPEPVKQAAAAVAAAVSSTVPIPSPSIVAPFLTDILPVPTEVDDLTKIIPSVVMPGAVKRGGAAPRARGRGRGGRGAIASHGIAKVVEKSEEEDSDSDLPATLPRAPKDTFPVANTGQFPPATQVTAASPAPPGDNGGVISRLLQAPITTPCNQPFTAAAAASIAAKFYPPGAPTGHAPPSYPSPPRQTVPPQQGSPGQQFSPAAQSPASAPNYHPAAPTGIRLRAPMPPFPSVLEGTDKSQTPPPAYRQPRPAFQRAPFPPPPYQAGSQQPYFSPFVEDPTQQQQQAPYPPNYPAAEGYPPQDHPSFDPQQQQRPAEEGSGEFGGLVSYFSSQREDDLET